jgi:hypothetical protein
MKKVYLVLPKFQTLKATTSHMCIDWESKIEHILSLYFLIVNRMSIRSSVLKHFKVMKKVYLAQNYGTLTLTICYIDSHIESQIQYILSLYFVILNWMSTIWMDLKHSLQMKKLYLAKFDDLQPALRDTCLQPDNQKFNKFCPSVFWFWIQWAQYGLI